MSKSAVLLEHHLKALRLPTMLREHGKVAQRCAQKNMGHVGFLLELVELEWTLRLLSRRYLPTPAREKNGPADSNIRGTILNTLHSSNLIPPPRTSSRSQPARFCRSSMDTVYNRLTSAIAASPPFSRSISDQRFLDRRFNVLPAFWLIACGE